MYKDVLTTAMTTSISEVLETMFFMPVDVVSVADVASAADPQTEAYEVRLDFSGPAAGVFRLHLPVELAREVASDFLGITPAAVTAEEMQETAKEMVNMLAGNTLSHYDSGAVFDLGVPEKVISHADEDRLRQGADSVCLDIRALSSRMVMTVLTRK